MSKNITVFIEHILESIHLIQTYTNHLSKDDFLASSQVQDAVIRRLEIIVKPLRACPKISRSIILTCRAAKSLECETR